MTYLPYPALRQVASDVQGPAQLDQRRQLESKSQQLQDSHSTLKDYQKNHWPMDSVVSGAGEVIITNKGCDRSATVTDRVMLGSLSSP